MLRRIYYYSFFLLCIFLLNSYDSLGQANRKKQRHLRGTSRKIANFKGKAVKFDSRKQYNGLGINLSSMNYFGDLSPSPRFTSTDYQFSRPQIGLTYMRRLGPRFSMRGAFAWGRIKGDDFYSADRTDLNAKFRYVRNLHFRNDIKELSVAAVFDLLENRGNYLRRVELTPYVFGGLAVFHHNPKARTPEDVLVEDQSIKPDSWIALQPLGTEGQGWLDGKKKYSRVQLSIPVGVGLRYRLNDALDLSFEVGYRHTFTDYLDDVSGYFVPSSQFSTETGESVAGGVLARAMADRSVEGRGGDAADDAFRRSVTANGYSSAEGNKRGTPNKDVYIVTGFHLTYVFIGTGIFGGNRRNAKFR